MGAESWWQLLLAGFISIEELPLHSKTNPEQYAYLFAFISVKLTLKEAKASFCVKWEWRFAS